MKYVTINKNDSGQRVDKFLLKFLPRLPASLMHKYIRKKRIKINNKRCQNFQKLQENDVLSLYINDDILENTVKNDDFLYASKSLDIVYEDKNLLIVDKKIGLLVHQDKSCKVDCLINRAIKHFFENGDFVPNSENTFKPALVNRIDRNTGGLVIIAKNAEFLRELNQKMKNREISKKYICAVLGILKEKQSIKTAYLIKSASENKVFISDNEFQNSKKIITKYKVLKEKNGISLLDVELLTGRTHQIRAHLAHLGHPILGDGKYGSNVKNSKFKHQALYSYGLKFNFSKTSNQLDYLNNRSFMLDYDKIWFTKFF